MNKSLELLINCFDRTRVAREVEAELQFHIEMQALDYEREGLTREESLARAELRFGNFARIKTQCIGIGLHEDARALAMKILFAIAFVLGVLIRTLGSQLNVVRVGEVLIMIGVLGGLLLYGKRLGRGRFRPEREAFRLGIADDFDSIPVSFDEKGRTPFERVRGD